MHSLAVKHVYSHEDLAGAYCGHKKHKTLTLASNSHFSLCKTVIRANRSCVSLLIDSFSLETLVFAYISSNHRIIYSGSITIYPPSHLGQTMYKSLSVNIIHPAKLANFIFKNLCHSNVSKESCLHSYACSKCNHVQMLEGRLTTSLKLTHVPVVNRQFLICTSSTDLYKVLTTTYIQTILFLWTTKGIRLDPPSVQALQSSLHPNFGIHMGMLIWF